jgi:hypothetical protein
MTEMSEQVFWDEELENESGMLDYEYECYEQAQKLLAADPAYSEWLDFINARNSATSEDPSDRDYSRDR